MSHMHSRERGDVRLLVEQALGAHLAAAVNHYRRPPPAAPEKTQVSEQAGMPAFWFVGADARREVQVVLDENITGRVRVRERTQLSKSQLLPHLQNEPPTSDRSNISPGGTKCNSIALDEHRQVSEIQDKANRCACHCRSHSARDGDEKQTEEISD
jgi:hypothetical protein